MERADEAADLYQDREERQLSLCRALHHTLWKRLGEELLPKAEDAAGVSVSWSFHDIGRSSQGDEASK